MNFAEIKKLFSAVVFIAITLFFYEFGLCESASIADAERILKETWMNVYLLGEKIGYLHEIKKETKYHNKPAFFYAQELVTQINRFGIIFYSVQTSEIYLEKNTFLPIYFQYVENLPGSFRRVKGEVNYNKLFLDLQVGETVTKQTIKWNESIYLDKSVDEIILKDGIIPGKEYKFTIYSPELIDYLDLTVTISSTETVIIDDNLYEGIKIITNCTKAPELSTISWITKEGDLLKMEFANLMTLTKTTKEGALSLDEKLEITQLCKVPTENKLPSKINSSDLIQMRIQVIHADLDPTKIIPEDTRQKWELTQKAELKAIKSGVLTVKSMSKKEMAELEKQACPLPIKSSDQSMLSFLESNPYVQAQDSEIVSTAKKIVGEQKNSFTAATILCDWVYNYLEKKDFSVGFASAKETLLSKQGDCTEHALLLAALARSLGIPTKIIPGLVYTEDGFYYHMWTEVFVGKWIPIDPALGQTQVDATHIKLGETALNEETFLVQQLLRHLNKLRLKIINYELIN